MKHADGSGRGGRLIDTRIPKRERSLGLLPPRPRGSCNTSKLPREVWVTGLNV